MAGAAAGMMAGPSTCSQLKNDLSCYHGGGGVLASRVYIPVAAAAGRSRVRKKFFTFRTMFLPWKRSGIGSRDRPPQPRDSIVCLYFGNRYDAADSHLSARATCGWARDIKRDSLAWHRSAKVTFSGIAENREFFQQDQVAKLRGKCSKMRKSGAPPGPALTAPRRSPAASARAGSSICRYRIPSAARPDWPPCPSAPRRHASH